MIPEDKKIEVLQGVKELTLERRGRVNYESAYSRYKDLLDRTRQIFEICDVDGILDNVADILKGLIDYSAMAYLMKEHFSDDYYFRKDWNLNRTLEKQIYRLEQSRYLDWACQSNKVAIYPENGQQNGVQPLWIIPFLAGTRVVGALVVRPKPRSDQLNRFDTELLSLLGFQAAIALENATLHADMEIKHNATSSIEAFLENSIESIADGLFATDLEEKFSLFNSAASSLLGISRERALGSRYDELFDEEFVELLDQTLKVTYTTGEHEQEISYLQPESKTRIPLGIHASILKDPNESVIGAIAVFRDLSEHQELIHLRRLDQLKDEFLSSVSHELRTPLTGIKSFTGILAEYGSLDCQNAKEFLDIINKETDRLIHLVDDLLDTSQLGRDDFELDVEDVNISAIVSEALYSLQFTADKKSISFDVRFDEDCQLVRSDPKRLAQVFVNIVGNAIKFSPAGSRVKIWSEQIPSGGRDDEDYLKIAVEDEGPGISKESRKTIFEKFSQIRDDPATKPEGAGLGLWICRQIVEKLKGNIWVENSEGNGSVFFFTLPHSKTYSRIARTR